MNCILLLVAYDRATFIKTASHPVVLETSWENQMLGG